MNRHLDLVIGVLIAIMFATMLLVVLPYAQLADIRPPKGLKPYTDEQLRGRAVYIREGCIYCHTQQPRDPGQTPADGARGWGRPSVPADYVHDRPPLLGTMRTGPDLFNIGARQPSQEWHLVHLYQPRAVVPGSIMPAYPYLFRHSREPAGQVEVNVPEKFRITGAGPIVATRDALDLVAYLKGLDHTYPIRVDEAESQTTGSRK
jgi:cytochrome c oxidase cbb3-type subunit 2